MANILSKKKKKKIIVSNVTISNVTFCPSMKNVSLMGESRYQSYVYF